MKTKIFPLFLLLSFSLYISCQNDDKPYAIKDFSNSLKPYLTKIISKGIVTFDSSTTYLENHATDKELVKLSMSEHPILRAIALRIILERPAFDHFEVIMNHLDDTAIIMTDADEWGIWDRTVSDYVIENARWKSNAEKNKTIEQLITKNKYLR